MSAEAIIRSDFVGVACYSVDPSAFFNLVNVELGNIGFDVQQGGAIEHVHIFHLQDVVVDADEFYHWKPNGIGPPGRPGGKYSVGLVVKEGDYLQIKTFWPVKLIDQVDMGKMLKIEQALNKPFLQYNDSFNSFRPAGLDGHPFLAFERGLDGSDGVECNGHFFIQLNRIYFWTQI